MAPKRRAARRADIASSVLPSIEIGGNPTPAPHTRDEGEDARTAWGREHFGGRCCELNEAYLHEKDHLQDSLKYYDMWKETRHIEAEKTTEHEREKKAALGDQYVPNPCVRLSESDDDNDGDTDSNSDKSKSMPDYPWERLEYARRHLHLYQSEEEYQAARVRIEAALKAQQEEKERKRSRKQRRWPYGGSQILIIRSTNVYGGV